MELETLRRKLASAHYIHDETLLTTLAVALSLLVLPAGAASTPEEALGEVNIYDGGYSMKYLAVNGKVQTQSYTYFLYENSAGEAQEIPAYCVNPVRLVP